MIDYTVGILFIVQSILLAIYFFENRNLRNENQVACDFLDKEYRTNKNLRKIINDQTGKKL